MAICTECSQEHCWDMVGDKYESVCGACCDKPNIQLDPSTGMYKRYACCSCGEYGPVNFEPNQYWCIKHPDKRML